MVKQQVSFTFQQKLSFIFMFLDTFDIDVRFDKEHEIKLTSESYSSNKHNKIFTFRNSSPN